MTDTNAFQSPPETVEPVVTPAPAVTPPTDVTPPTPATEPPANPPWQVRRIGELTAQTRARQERIDALEAELAAERAARTAPPTPAPQPGQTPPAPTPAPTTPQPQFTAADIEVRAQQLAEKSQFDAASQTSYEAGKVKYPDFDAKLQTFKMLGGLSDAQIQAALATGSAHDVLYTLGSNPDEAARIMSLPPLQSAVEMAKIVARQPVAARASAAPAPITPVGSGGTRLPEGLADELPDDEWFRRRNEQKKAQRRA